MVHKSGCAHVTSGCNHLVMTKKRYCPDVESGTIIWLFNLKINIFVMRCTEYSTMSKTDMTQTSVDLHNTVDDGKM